MMELTAYLQPVSKLCFPLLMQRKHWHRILKGPAANNSSFNFKGQKEDGKWSCYHGNPYSFTLFFSETWSRIFFPALVHLFNFHQFSAVWQYPAFLPSMYLVIARLTDPAKYIERGGVKRERESEREARQKNVPILVSGITKSSCICWFNA